MVRASVWVASLAAILVSTVAAAADTVIGGIVTDDRGRPLSGVLYGVEDLYDADGVPYRKGFGSINLQRTGPDGRFAYTCRNVGESAAFAFSHPDFAVTVSPRPFAASEPVTIAMDRGVLLEGTLAPKVMRRLAKRLDDQPIEVWLNCTVAEAKPNYPFTVGADGRFLFRIPTDFGNHIFRLQIGDEVLPLSLPGDKPLPHVEIVHKVTLGLPSPTHVIVQYQEPESLEVVSAKSDVEPLSGD